MAVLSSLSSVFDFNYVIYSNVSGITSNHSNSNLNAILNLLHIPLSTDFNGTFRINTLNGTLTWSGTNLCFIADNKSCSYLKFKSKQGNNVLYCYQNNMQGNFSFGDSGTIPIYEIGFGMKKDATFLENDEEATRLIKTGDDPIRKDVKEQSFFIEKSNWTYLGDWCGIAGYGIQDKALCGHFSKNMKSSVNNYYYTTSFKRVDGKSIRRPQYWTFAKGGVRVCFSNLDSIVVGTEDYNNGVDLEGYARQPWVVREKSWWARDEVDRATDDTKEWWNKSNVASVIYSTEADNDGVGHSYYSNGYYFWENAYPNTTKIRMSKYIAPNQTPSISILNNKLKIEINNQPYEYTFKENQKIVLVKRKLLDLEQLLNDNGTDYKNFALIYGTNNSSKQWDELFLMAGKWSLMGFNDKFMYNKYNTQTNLRPLFYRDDRGYTVPYSGFYIPSRLTYGYDYELETVPYEEELVTVTLPDLEFYDITEKITDSLFIQNMLINDDDNNDELNNVKLKNLPIWFNDIFEKKEQETYVFNFEPPFKGSQSNNNFSGSIYTHNGVKYLISIKNIYTLLDYQSTVKRHSECKCFLQNVGHTNHGKSATISSSIIVQDYFSWKTPKWFKNHFINFGYDAMGVIYNEQDEIVGYIDSDLDSHETDVNKDTSHADWYLLGEVTGWDRWSDNFYNNFGPVETSYAYDNASRVQGYYLANVKYLNPYTPFETSRTSYYAINDHQKNGKGVQLGLTTGILINYPNVNTMEYKDNVFNIPQEKECAFAIIICDEY